MPGTAIQDLIPHNHCYGCGPDNSLGLRLKSYWDGSGISVAEFSPQAHHCAGPMHFVSGGILATLVDCHCVCTAIAASYRDAGREIGEPPHVHCATAALELRYRRPTPIDAVLKLSARIVSADDGHYVLSCDVVAAGRETVTARVEAVRVAAAWMHGPRS